MTEIDLMLERERHFMLNGDLAKNCPKCQAETYQNTCPVGCVNDEGEPLTFTGDELIDDLYRKAERGEDVDLDDLFPAKPKFSSNEGWTPVTVDDLG